MGIRETIVRNHAAAAVVGHYRGGERIRPGLREIIVLDDAGAEIVHDTRTAISPNGGPGNVEAGLVACESVSCIVGDFSAGPCQSIGHAQHAHKSIDIAAKLISLVDCLNETLHMDRIGCGIESVDHQSVPPVLAEGQALK